jgi:hypothetical protein
MSVRKDKRVISVCNTEKFSSFVSLPVYEVAACTYEEQPYRGYKGPT